MSVLNTYNVEKDSKRKLQSKKSELQCWVNWIEVFIKLDICILLNFQSDANKKKGEELNNNSLLCVFFKFKIFNSFLLFNFCFISLRVLDLKSLDFCYK